jgi:hypothetical protein
MDREREKVREREEGDEVEERRGGGEEEDGGEGEEEDEEEYYSRDQCFTIWFPREDHILLQKLNDTGLSVDQIWNGTIMFRRDMGVGRGVIGETGIRRVTGVRGEIQLVTIPFDSNNGGMEQLRESTRCLTNEGRILQFPEEASGRYANAFFSLLNADQLYFLACGEDSVKSSSALIYAQPIHPKEPEYIFDVSEDPMVPHEVISTGRAAQEQAYGCALWP